MTWRVWTKFLILIVSLTPNKEDHSGLKVLSFIWDDKLLVFWHSTLTSEVKHEDECYCRCSHETKCLWFFILFQNVISIICCELGTVYFCDLSYMKLLYLIENSQKITNWLLKCNVDVYKSVELCIIYIFLILHKMFKLLSTAYIYMYHDLSCIVGSRCGGWLFLCY